MSQSILILETDTGEPFEYSGTGVGVGAVVGAGVGVAVGAGVATGVAVGAVAVGEAGGAGEVQPDIAKAAINNDTITMHLNSIIINP